MSDTLAHKLQQRLDYHFADPALLRQALTHSSAGAANYERLEHLGDAVLDLAVSYWLYRAFPHFGPGQMSILRAELVRAPTLARLARDLDLPWAIRLSLHAEARGLHHRTSVLSDVFEAVLGAVFVDAGGALAPVDGITRMLFAPLAQAFIHRNSTFYHVPSHDLSLETILTGG